ncbi:MAG: peptidylprolyl isomerase [Candidatus Omnitrophica bacterium]|nr:peptidylprolyl isomerase [Candidatus Omnitrophota bacterium]
MDYTLTVDGEVVDQSPEGKPFQYIHGKGQIIPGLERQLTGLRVGDSGEITVTPEEGYGPVDPAAVVEIPKEQLPKTVTPEVGMALSGVDPEGRPFRARVKTIHDTTVTLDLNHPLAGKTLLFKIKVITITPSAS